MNHKGYLRYKDRIIHLQMLQTIQGFIFIFYFIRERGVRRIDPETYH